MVLTLPRYDKKMWGFHLDHKGNFGFRPKIIQVEFRLGQHPSQHALVAPQPKQI